eukprot:gnl/MRDRNA2_/MRDRNA2_36278_c0_seq1.p1 gnl/MRDRNA2_/MRDRNA2_36278_c0~~gnl/MRDRNA2_/MRDRNA2_36278_c0_seq1.p1  ORF type:complete len:229 (+),score=42.07 gnl/MRDRNA2_/MRDRNA2_36278_c0_seq1:192-878(+)
MFKGFSKDDIKKQDSVNKSVQRGIRSQILEQYPRLPQECFDTYIWPKDATMKLAKCKDHINMVVVGGEPIFFQHRDGPWFPTLKVVHKFPFMMPKVQVDKGAIKFVLRGADVMCPGLTSAGGAIPENLEAGTVIQITAEGKENACAVGRLAMSTQEIRTKNVGHCITDTHHMTDGLWCLGPTLYDVDVDSNRMVAVFAVIFIVGLIGFRRFCRSCKQVQGLHEDLMHT